MGFLRISTSLHTDIVFAHRYRLCTQISSLHTDIVFAHRYRLFTQISSLHTDIVFAHRYRLCTQISSLHTDIVFAHRYNEAKCQSSVVLLSDKHNCTDFGYLVFHSILSTSVIIRALVHKKTKKGKPSSDSQWECAGLPLEFPLFLSGFSEKNFPDRFLKIPQI